MKLRYSLILIFNLTCNAFLFSQSNSSIDTLIKKSSQFLYTDVDSSIYYAKKAIELSYETDDVTKRISSYRILGNAYFMNNLYWVAEDSYKQALSIAEEENDTVQLAYSMANLANVYNTTKEYKKALRTYHSAYDILVKCKDSISQAKVLNNIGLIYQYQKKYGEALTNYKKSLALKGSLEDTIGMAPTLANMGIVLMKYDKPKEAIKKLLKAIEIFQKAKSTQRAATTKIMLADIYFELGQTAKAQKYLEEFEADETSITSIEFKFGAHKTLAKIYKSKGNYKKALAHYEKFKIFEDSVQHFEKAESQELYKSMLVNEKSKKEIAELKITQSENEVYQSNLEVKFAKSDYNNIIMISAMIVLGIMSIALFIVLFLRNKNLKRELTYNELKSGIVHVVSHEFRTPLAGIMSSSELLRSEIKEEQELKFLDRIDKSSEHMLEILTSFTEPIEYKKEKFSMKKIAIQETTKEIVADVITDNEVDFNFITEQNDLFLSKTIYTVILRNLLTNAVKYGKENGRIIISITQPSKNLVQIEVEDFGHGISKKLQKTIFEKGDRGIQTDNRGDGMGLFIVKSYLDLIGGTIKVKSKINQGSIFTVVMPIWDL